MSFRGEIMRRRLDRCEESLRPPGSFAARLHALHPEHKRIYEAWKTKRAAYWSLWKGEEPYRVLIGDICSLTPEPVLPSYVSNLLHPQPDPRLSPQEQYELLLESM